MSAKSSLVLEFSSHMMKKSMNLRSQVNVPGDFADFIACHGNSEIVSHTGQYSIDFDERK